MGDEGPDQTCSSTCPCETNPHGGQKPETIGGHNWWNQLEGSAQCMTSEVVSSSKGLVGQCEINV